MGQTLPSWVMMSYLSYSWEQYESKLRRGAVWAKFCQVGVLISYLTYIIAGGSTCLSCDGEQYGPNFAKLGY